MENQKLCLSDIGENISNEIYTAIILYVVTPLVELRLFWDNEHAEPGTVA